MAVNVKFFASLREYTGVAETRMDFQDGLSVEQLWSVVMPDKEMPLNTLASINMEYVELSESVQDGDEVAFFPPVTGG